MKMCALAILEANAGPLTNFEVLDFLRSKGASKDPTRVLVPVTPSEFKVYDYLVESSACNQSREKVNEFLEKSKKFNLAKAEILNIINIRPSSLVEIDSILEQSDTRFQEEELQELVDLIIEVLPPLVKQPNAEEAVNDDVEGTTEEVQAGGEDKKESADGEGTNDDTEETADLEPMTDS